MLGIIHKKENMHTHTNLQKNRQHKRRQISTRTQKPERLVAVSLNCENFEMEHNEKNKQLTSHPQGKLILKKIQRANQNT